MLPCCNEFTADIEETMETYQLYEPGTEIIDVGLGFGLGQGKDKKIK